MVRGKHIYFSLFLWSVATLLEDKGRASSWLGAHTFAWLWDETHTHSCCGRRLQAVAHLSTRCLNFDQLKCGRRRKKTKTNHHKNPDTLGCEAETQLSGMHTAEQQLITLSAPFPQQILNPLSGYTTSSKIISSSWTKTTSLTKISFATKASLSVNQL